MSTEDDDLDLRIQELEANPDTRRAAEATERSEEAARGVFGQLKWLREAQRLTQAELAVRVGTSQPAIARLEAGISDPRLSTVQRLSVALGQELELSLHAHTAFIAELVAAWNEKDQERWRLALSDQVFVSGPGLGETEGQDAAEQVFRAWHEAFPESSVESCWQASVAGRVVLEGVFHGRHDGVLRGPAGEEFGPTGKQVDLPFVAVGTIAGEKVERLTIYADTWKLMRDLGAVEAAARGAFA